jgi:metallo-beta-lactamase family protein
VTDAHPSRGGRGDGHTRLRFLGAATSVTGSHVLVRTPRARVVVDCGLFQGSPSEVERNRVALAYDPARLDAVLITHAHLDHCGLLPVIVREGFKGPVYATAGTAELAALVLLDSARVQREQAAARQERAERLDGAARRQRTERLDRALPRERTAPPGPGRAAAADPGGPVDPEATLRRQPPRVETAVEAPLYSVEDAADAAELFVPVRYGMPREVAPGVRATFHDAGHILGSAIIVLDIEDGSERGLRIVFSGDVGRPGTPILRDPTAIIDGADYVVMESTYGGREHGPEQEAVRMLAEIVRSVASSSGVLLIPAFAIGRTQEIVWHLDRLLSAGRIPHVPLYLDSPMASLASEIYRRHPDAYDEETSRLLEEGETPLDYPGAIVTNAPEESRAIPRAPRPMVIVASSGMLTGGRVLHHLRELIDDERALLLFVGYQGEGTLGAHLQAGAREIWLDGQARPVRCRVRTISGFSAHADDPELLDWLAHLARAPRRPRRVFLVHGDPEARLALEPGVRRLGLEPYLPAWREEVALS